MRKRIPAYPPSRRYISFRFVWIDIRYKFEGAKIRLECTTFKIVEATSIDGTLVNLIEFALKLY
jgi:hypothetical protein